MCLDDEPVTKKSTWRCKRKKRGLPVSVVKKELQFAEKLSPGRPWLYYNNYNPNMDRDDMPCCLDLLFRSTKEMKFFDKELVIAAYIFGNNLDPEQNCVGTMKYIKNNLMGDLASLHQIFVPVYLNDHWFLIVVDLLHELVRYLDSFKKGTLMTEHKNVINNMVNYLENLLSDKNFGQTPSFRNIQFSKYKFDEPAIPQQSAKSNDCGIWVAQWMQYFSYPLCDIIVVNDYTKMRLAMDLVNDSNNSKRDIIVELAVTDWNKKMQQFVMQT
ncbi:hypothetical protein Ahy_B06g082602 [Arachis hypogaea]|uniref:Ubiquitin-like protease family profile domain-containing protein n=1 Tax=Arachis hypogaea TaxID=3818 RepID=A0A444YNM2_ARAHY|nr:hypothetical protein Ahy_B06g082602 [Arachis hypogaea]